MIEIDRLKMRKLLLDKRVTQKDIAKEIGVSGAVVSSWFAKERLPDQYIIHLKKILQINSFDEFVKSNESNGDSTVNSKKKADCTHFIQRIQDLEANLKDKQVIIDLLQQQVSDLRHFAKTAQ